MKIGGGVVGVGAGGGVTVRPTRGDRDVEARRGVRVVVDCCRRLLLLLWLGGRWLAPPPPTVVRGEVGTEGDATDEEEKGAPYGCCGCIRSGWFILAISVTSPRVTG